MFKRYLFAGLAAGHLALLAACDTGGGAPTAAQIAAESARLTEYLNAEFEEELAMSPERLTSIGRKEQYDRLNDYSEQAVTERLEWRRQSVAGMKSQFDPAKLDEASRTSFDIWALELDRAEERDKWRRHGYIFARGGVHTGLPTFLINLHEVKEVSDMEAYNSRLANIANAIDQTMERAQLNAAAGVRPPRFAYEESIAEARKVITGRPFDDSNADSPLWGDVTAKIAALKAAGKAGDQQALALTEVAEAHLTTKVKRAYEDLIAWLEADKANAPVEARGVLTLPDGASYYNAQLKLQTTTEMTADEIHELGLAEVARLRGEMEAVKAQVGFDGTLDEFFVFMRTNPQFILPNTDEGRAQYIRLAEDHLAAMKAKLPEYFGVLPKGELVVKRVEPFREQPGAAQHYRRGSVDGSRPGTFYAHLSDMNAMPVFQLEAVAYHEGNPGHHMQGTIAQEMTGLPVFRTQYGYTAFSEGWALYTEALAKEMGFYTDPYSDFGRLSTEIWRAVRLVVDTGLHAKGWSEEEAVQYFLANSASAEGAVRSEIQRYILSPGQATTYKIGMLKIQELREAAKTGLGDKFDIRAFHDVVLGSGGVPLPVLETLVQRWVERVKAAG